MSSRARTLAILPEAALIALARGDDRDAYGELVRRHARSVRAFIAGLGAAPDLADDVAQETFLTALTDIRRFRGEGSLAAWLRTIAARALFRRRRKDKSNVTPWDPGQAEAVEGMQPDPNEALDLHGALGRLSQGERICVMLSHGAGFSHPEIAEATGLALGTVKSHINRGLQKLRILLSIHRTEGGSA